MPETGFDSLMKNYSGNFGDFLNDYKETAKLNIKKKNDSKDWRSMSDEEWKKTLESFDKYVEAWQKEIDKKQEKQQEAGEKAALNAPPGMRSIAASQAMLAVAASGFYAGNFSDIIKESMAEK